MDPFILCFYLIEACVVVKNFIMNLFELLLEYPCIAKSYYCLKSFLIDLHNQIYHIRTEPSGIPWMSLSYVKKESIYSYEHRDGDSDIIVEPKYTITPRYTLMDDYATKPNHIFGYSFSDHSDTDSKIYLFPSYRDSCPNFIEDLDKDELEKHITLYEDSILKCMFHSASNHADPTFPVMYMMKTSDEDMIDYVKDPLEFFSYMIVHFPKDVSENQINTKLTRLALQRRPSKIRFLNVEYSHPDMKSRVVIKIPENIFYVGNELLSSTFLLRYLEYHLGKNNFVFDERYCVYVVTKNIDYIELSHKKYILLDRVNSYKVMEHSSEVHE